MQRVSVVRIDRPAIGIKRFELVSASDAPLAPFHAGDHIEICTPDGHSRAYSLCGDPADTTRYVVAVLRESWGRGGSKAMHDKLAIGSQLDVSEPRSAFPLEEGGKRWRLIGGGIGATPLIAMAYRLHAIGADFEFHYAASNQKKLIFLDVLRTLLPPEKLHLHVSEGDPAARFDPAAWLADPAHDTFVYCCGPEQLMKSVRAATEHWPEGSVRFETFKPSIPEDAAAFEVELARSGAVVPVRETESILVALWRAGFPRPLSCETGICGTCRTPYIGGTPDHRDEILTKDERKHEIMICVSRCKTDRLILDI